MERKSSVVGDPAVLTATTHPSLASFRQRTVLPRINVAFQPIVNLQSRTTTAFEALVRGPQGQSYPELVTGMDEATLRLFDCHAAAEAIRRAVKLELGKQGASLCINVLPDLHPQGLNAYFVRDAAQFYGLPINKIVLEMTENHHLSMDGLNKVLCLNRELGFVTAMDDFGAGYCGLTALVECRPEILKLDRALVRSIDTSVARQKIVGAFVGFCSSMQIVLVAEGVETEGEAQMLTRLGIHLMQGYLFSRPITNRLPHLSDEAYLGCASRVGTPALRQLPGEWMSERFATVTGGQVLGLGIAQA